MEKGVVRMEVREIMNRNIYKIQLSEPIITAAKIMDEKDVGIIPVFDKERLAGLITDRDLVIRGVTSDLDLANDPVRDIMSPAVVSISEESSVQEAAELMERKQIRRLLVRDKDDKVCGIVSLSDIARHMSKKLSGEILQEVTQPSVP